MSKVANSNQLTTSTQPRKIPRQIYEHLEDQHAMYEALQAALSDGRAVIVDEQGA